MESISHWDKQGGNTCAQRCKDSEIVAERFKASAKQINQNLADAIVSVQTGCRGYQVEQPVSNIRQQLSMEQKHSGKDNYSDDKCYKWRWDTSGLEHFEWGCRKSKAFLSCFHPFTTNNKSFTLLVTILQAVL